MRSSSPRFRTASISILCSSLCLGSLSPTAAKAARPAPFKKLSKPAQIDLLLSRFTFGPTPADRQAVERLGPVSWFDQQLQPGRIDDEAFERRMDRYPALRMTQADRLQRYPEPATLRQIAKSGVLPSDPEGRAIVGDQVEFYELRRQKVAANSTETASAMQQTVDASLSSAPSATRAQAAGDVPARKLEESTEPMPRAQVNAILGMMPLDRYGYLLSMPPASLIALRKATRGPLEVRLSDGMTPLQKETLLALTGTNRMISAEVLGSRLLRDIYSQRQVEAVMTDFWLNHFNVYSGKSGQEPSLLPDFEKTVRTHALGRLEDLLVATAQSPAMLLYLDNAQSTGPNSQAAQRQRFGPGAKSNSATKSSPGLNENYAREVMELHTLGVNGGYTQQDVTEVAKVFTGWTLERPNDGGSYTFAAKRHEPGTKKVLGREIVEAGEQEGYEVLHLLATSPSTAHFLSEELAQRFVSDTPPVTMVERMARTFLSSGGDIREVLRTMVLSPEFFTESTVHAKLKTPLEYVTSAVRASGAEVTDPMPLVQSLQRLGMPLYGCQPPTGYKWDQATWLSSSALINRMNFALSLSTNRIGGTAVDWMPVLADAAALQPIALTQPGTDASVTRKESILEKRLLSVPVSAQTRAAVLSQGTDETAKQAAQQFASVPARRQLTDAEIEAQQQDRLDAMMAGKMKGAKDDVKPYRGLAAVTARRVLPPADPQAAAMAGLLLGSPEFQRR